MAGLYGFLARDPQPAGQVRDRLHWMRTFMTSRPTHRFVEHAVDGAGVGITGRGVFDSTIALHEGPSRRTLVVDGEVYHVSQDGRAFDGGAAWPIVHARWIAGGPDAMADVDGLYNGVEIDPCTPAGARLSIFNDRYGSRRLYYVDLADAFVFASEMAPLVAWLGAVATIDDEFLTESVCFGSAFGDHTWIRGISLFPPATAMTVSRDGVTMRRYWQWSDAPPPGTHAGADRFDVLHELWRRAMQARVKGPRVGQQLTGGLDSRLILGEAIRHRGDWTSATYGEPGSDDVRFAERSAKTAGVPWLFWELPGNDWLARRVALCLEHDGIVDLVNAHHAGLVKTLGEAMDVEVSGYLGDAVAGGTGLDLAPDTAMDHIPYWPSPVSLHPAEARARVDASVARAPNARVWMIENKWRRATNAWPHMAVNDLEVRKPFMDYALVEYCAGLPFDDRRTRRAQIEMLRRRYPALARVPWQKTGVRPAAGPLARAAIKAVRLAYRTVQPPASRVGIPLRPWMRNACNVDAWCASPDVRRTLTDTLSDRAALVAGYFDRDAIARTLAMAFDRHEVAIEVPMNLYRAEHMLQRFRDARRVPMLR
jgi:asparagine synthetase B (glutamine-hydrolysing)